MQYETMNERTEGLGSGNEAKAAPPQDCPHNKNIRDHGGEPQVSDFYVSPGVMCAHPGVTGGGAKALEESERPIRPKRCPVCCLRDEQAVQLAQ